MAATDSQKTDLLWKKFFGVSVTSTLKQFFEEAFLGRPKVLNSQIWAESAKIPTTAPGGADGATTGVVTRYIARSMTAVAGTTNSFSLAQLKNAIDFNFGDGSYNYALTDSAGTAIPFGTNDWVVDTDAGTLTFFNGVPANMPPKISFYAYSGMTGASSDTIGETPLTLTEGATNSNVTGLAFAGSSYKTATVSWQLYRNSTGAGAKELVGGGTFALNYKPVAASWIMTPLEQWGEDTGITFDVTAAGQVRYSLPTITGTSPTSTLKFRARTFTA